MSDAGVFTISLDTELAWGTFDHGGHRRHERAYRATPAVVERLCALFERYDVPATWAFVAHLFEDCGETHARIDEVDREMPCVRGVDERLWYAPGLLDTVRNCTVEQDVGLHGYTHLVVDEHARSTVDRELAAAVAAAARHDVDPVSFVYPRNRIAYVDLLADHGFEVYRGVDARWYERTGVPSAVRRSLRFADEALSVAPPVVEPHEREGVVCVPGSQVFRPDHAAWGLTPDGTQVTRARKGLDRAAATGGVFHLWWHPFNFGRDPDRLVPKLERILSYADDLRTSGRLELRSLRSIASEHRAGRWETKPSVTNRHADNGVTT